MYILYCIIYNIILLYYVVIMLYYALRISIMYCIIDSDG